MRVRFLRVLVTRRLLIPIGLCAVSTAAMSSGCSQNAGEEGTATVQEQVQALMTGAGGEADQSRETGVSGPKAVASPVSLSPFASPPAGSPSPFYEPPPLDSAAAASFAERSSKVANAQAVTAQKPLVAFSSGEPGGVAPETIAKQSQYLQQWQQLQPSLAALPLEIQEQRRADLKKATLGN